MGLRPRHGVAKTAVVDGFEQVVHRVHFRRVQCILLVGSQKDHAGQTFFAARRSEPRGNRYAKREAGRRRRRAET